MPRWLRVIVSLVAAYLGGWAAMLAIGGPILGIAWLYLFGDDPWPGWGELVLNGILYALFASGAVVAGWTTWKVTVPRDE